MYEEIKSSLKWVNKKALIAVGMIAVIFMIMGVFFFSLISLVLGILLICIIFKTLSYSNNLDMNCKQIENYLNMTPAQLDQALRQSKRIEMFSFVNDDFFVDFRCNIVFRTNCIAKLETVDKRSTGGQTNPSVTYAYFLNVTLKNGIVHELFYSKENRDELHFLLSKHVNMPIGQAVSAPKKIEYTDNTDFFSNYPNKKIDLGKHLPSENVTAHLTYERNAVNMPSEKKERFSVSCINAYPKYLGKPSTSYKKLMKSLILKNSIFIFDFVIGAAFLIFGLLMAKITGIVIISFFAAPFFLHCIITLLTERKNVRNNYYAFLSKFRMYDNRQFEEMIASSVRISKFGYINDDYFFMADKLYGIKLSDIRNVSESAFVNNRRHFSSITFFLSGSSVRIDFQNEKERDFVINVMRKVLKYRFDA